MPSTLNPRRSTSSLTRCISSIGNVESCGEHSHTLESRKDTTVVIMDKKSGWQRSLAASTPHDKNWMRRRSNNPSGALSKHTHRFPSHSSQSPHCKRSQTHRPTSDPAGNCHSGSRTHISKTDTTAPVLCATM